MPRNRAECGDDFWISSFYTFPLRSNIYSISEQTAKYFVVEHSSSNLLFVWELASSIVEADVICWGKSHVTSTPLA